MDTMIYEQVKHLVNFMVWREDARMNKEADLPKPWTKDKIIQTYRFCNVNREHDRVTKYIRHEWAEQGYSETWFNLVVGRILNNPGSLDVLRIMMDRYDDHEWGTSYFINRLTEFKEAGNNVFNAAYIVSTAGATEPKIEYYATRVLAPIWEMGKGFDITGEPDTLEDWFNWLTQFRSIGAFIGNQIVTDMRYHNMKMASDWTTFVMPGPGTSRGLNRLYGRPIEKSLKLSQGQQEILVLREVLNANFNIFEHTLKDPNNLSNCLCEFDKYMRVFNDEGRTPKQKYPGI